MPRRSIRPNEHIARTRLLLLLSLLGMFLAGASISAHTIFDTVREAVLIWGAQEVEGVAPLSGPPSPRAGPGDNAPRERINILLLGVDHRPGERCPCRTDVMMIATLNSRTMTAGLVTIPRDLYVPILGVGEQRINTAYFYGDLYKHPGGGPALAKKTVEYNFGRPVHYYVLVDFQGFRNAVDALGGIDVDVLKAIDDSKYPDDTLGKNPGYKPVHIPAGRVHMDGEMALEYVRTRNVDSDFGRSKRQIQVLLAMRDKALRPDWLPRLPVLLKSMWGMVDTDLSFQQVLAWAPVVSKVRVQDLVTGSIDQRMTVEFRTREGAEVLWWDRAEVGRLLDRIIPLRED